MVLKKSKIENNIIKRKIITLIILINDLLFIIIYDNFIVFYY
jgi:hypothetical protein